MKYEVHSVEGYLEAIPEERKPYFQELRNTILQNLPKGFEELFQYGMVGYAVPHTIYPDGYHCNPKEPLPFASIASQKNFIGFYHMGMYAKPEILNWFTQEWPKYSKYKLDMGKSCIRLKKLDDIPYALIGQLMQKLTVEDWITLYEQSFKK